MKSALKSINSKQLIDFFHGYKGVSIENFHQLPLFFSIKEEGGNKSLQR